MCVRTAWVTSPAAKTVSNPQTQGVQCHHPRLFRSFLSQAVRSLDALLSVIALRAHSLYSPFPLRLSLDTFSPCLESPPLPARSRWAVTRKRVTTPALNLLVIASLGAFCLRPRKTCPSTPALTAPLVSPMPRPGPLTCAPRLSHTGSGSGGMPTADH